MSRIYQRVRRQAAQAPGTVQYVGEQKVESVDLRVIDYLGERFDERSPAGVEDCFDYRDSDTTTWIDVVGLHDVELLGRLGDHFGIHPLVREDIVNTHQRPKLEEFEGLLFLVCRMISWNEETARLESEQLSLVLTPGSVISFQERPGDVFEPVRERLRRGKGRIRNGGPDYLAYALLDAVVDNYFVVLERFGEEIETLEDALLVEPVPEHLQTIHELKRELILLRRSVWPLREVVSSLERLENELVQPGTAVYLRDLYDHTIQIVDAVESFRDLLSGLQDLYLSSISNKMNEVMKVLTIAATIFVPLTFFAGIYGMNFEHMPELAWRWSYPIFWGLMLIAGGGMVVFFRRRRWL